MTDYIVILNLETEEILYHELTESDREMLQDGQMLYTDEGFSKFFDKFQLDCDKCLWMFTTELPKLTEI